MSTDSFQRDSPFLQGLLAPVQDERNDIDLEKGTSQKYTYGDTVTSGEHVFAPNANPESEDDGYLLAYASDEDTEKSELMILDAQDVAAGPVARVQFPRRVPIGFHANWLAES